LNGLIRLTIISGFLLVCPVRAQEVELIGQGSDGNRGTVVHVIELFDDEDKRIRPTDSNPKPFSPRQTCGKCHDYEMISGGWHFNSHDPKTQATRSGQPWILTDAKTRTQVPISGRKWEGTFTPEEFDISPWEFVKMNFSHFPGGSYGQMDADEPDEMIRQDISGKYEINCLACHNADPHQDQSEAALQAARQNYRWIPAGSSGMAEIGGVASSLDDFFDPEFDEGVTLKYKDGLFDRDDKVFFDIANSPANERCYFCHSNQNLSVSEDKEWTRNEDVHLASGLHCVDCHRNGDDHMITRGIESKGLGKTLTCQGCHLGESENVPDAGQLGAPKPPHRGIPTIHFEKMTCTACHSGPWPKEQAGSWKTARMHKTGLHGKHGLDIRQPHVYAPVLMKGADGKIGPYKLFWPAYWATVKEDSLSPIAPDRIMELAGDMLNMDADKVDDWRPLTEQQIAGVLTTLNSDEEEAAYIAGGKLYQLDAEGKITSVDHDAAKPYAWPMAHDVRPAEQSLGVRNCKDCHTTDSAFFFGKTEVDTPINMGGSTEFIEMVELQGINRLYIWAFNASFVFRPFLKIVAFAACGLIALVLLTYTVRAVAAISHACTEETE